MTHLDEVDLVDAMDGVLDAARSGHLDACARCRGELSSVQGALSLAREAEIPEPPGMYWPAFRRQLSRRLEEPAPQRRFAISRLFAGLAAAAAVVVVALGVRPHDTVRAPSAMVQPGATLPAWTPLPPADEDEGLDVLGGVPARDTACAGLAECLDDLSDDESRALAESLRRELEGASS